MRAPFWGPVSSQDSCMNGNKGAGVEGRGVTCIAFTPGLPGLGAVKMSQKNKQERASGGKKAEKGGVCETPT